MNAMTTHIKQPGMADSLESVLKAELSKSVSDVLSREGWTNGEIVSCNRALAHETAEAIGWASGACDSIKGEDAFSLVYLYSGSSPDVITLTDLGKLALTECKYGIKYGGPGPFRSAQSFKLDIAKKFDKTEAVLLRDNESVRGLRVLIVSHDQLPFTIAHVNALKQMDLSAGACSTDGKKHLYVVCSTLSARKMTEPLTLSRLDPGECLVFRL